MHPGKVEVRAALLGPLLLLAACGSEAQVPAEAAVEASREPANLAAPESSPATETQPPEVHIPERPPEDPSLAGLSPSRRREYDNGYRDCRAGNYEYDAQTQGEYYRIGCMAAENLKAGAEP